MGKLSFMENFKTKQVDRPKRKTLLEQLAESLGQESINGQITPDTETQSVAIPAEDTAKPVIDCSSRKDIFVDKIQVKKPVSKPARKYKLTDCQIKELADARKKEAEKKENEKKLMKAVYKLAAKYIFEASNQTNGDLEKARKLLIQKRFESDNPMEDNLDSNLAYDYAIEYLNHRIEEKHGEFSVSPTVYDRKKYYR